MRTLELGLLRVIGWGGAAALAASACVSGSSHSAGTAGTGAVAGLDGVGGTATDAGAGGDASGGTSGKGAAGETATGGSSGSAGRPSGSTEAGMPCVIQAECAPGLQCIATRCTPDGSSGEGEECLLDSACEAGLRCVFAGLTATCQSQGDGNKGDDCELSTDCAQGLACSSGSCETQPPGIPVFKGVECDPPSKDDVAAYFEVPGAEDADEGDYFRLPFPNDILRSDDGLDLSGFPTPGPGALGVDAVKLYADAIEENDDGFGAYSTVLFRFSGLLDASTVGNTPTSSPAAWIDVTPGAADPWASVGLSWTYSIGRNQYICDNWLGARRPRGVPLVPGHTYAVFLTTQLKACAVVGDAGQCAENAPIAQPKNLVSLLAQSAPDDPVLASAYAKYAPLRDYLAENNIEAATILNATVFTVGNVRDTMESVADAVSEMPEPPELVPDSWTKCADGVDSPCPDRSGTRGCSDSPAEFDEYHALVKLPIFQDGTPPYLTPADGGGIVVKKNQPTDDVCLSLTVPTGGSMPTGGWPLVVFAHGTGGSFRDHAQNGVARELASGSVKFAVLGIDQVEHGPRRGDSTATPDNLFFNFMNPAAARGNPIQGAADQLSLARFAERIDGSGQAPTTIDVSKLFFFGHSQGATEGSLMLPYGDAYKAAVLSGNGASLMHALLTKSKPVDIKSLLPLAVSDLAVTGETGEFHPVLTLLQQWIDPADPLNFARHVATEPLVGHSAKHLFQTYGRGDSYSPPVTLATYARAGGLTLVNPVLEDTEAAPIYMKFSTADAPLSGNLQNGTITQGMRQYDKASGSDGHFVVFDVETAQDDMLRFFREAVTGVPSIGN